MEIQQPAPMRSNKVLKWLLIIGIVIVLNLFFVYGIKVFYNAPSFENFCPVNQVTTVPSTQAECVANGGGWTSNPNSIQSTQQNSVVPSPKNPTIIATVPEQPAGYCDINFTCQKNFTAANSIYNRNVFVALVILGVLSLIAGFFIQKTAAVSLGISLGGVLALVVASVRYWSDMNDYLRFGVLAIALAILIILGVKKIKN